MIATTTARGVPLRLILVILVTGLVVLGTLGTTAFFVLSFRDYARAEVDQTINRSLDAVHREAEALLLPVGAVVEHVKGLPNEMITGSPGAGRSRFDPFLDSLELVASFETRIDAIFLGLPDGSTAYVGRNTQALRDVAELPADSRRSPHLRLVRDAANDAPVDHWLWRHDQDWFGVNRPRLDYDPRNRPWYTLGEQSTTPAWTPLYRSVGDKSYDLTLALGLHGEDHELDAVLGIDIRLDDLVGFVNKLDISPNGFAFVAKPNGELLAHPSLDMAQLVEQSSEDEPTLFSVARSDHADLRLFELFAGSDLDAIEFGIQGETFLARRLPLSSYFGLGADLYVGAPVSDFTAASNEALGFALVLSAVLALIVVGTGILISKAIAQPIDHAVQAMQSLSRLDLQEPSKPTRSVLAEINTLNETVALMRTALSSFSQYVPVQIVHDLTESRQPLTLGGSRREITVFFSDIADFTRMTESEQHETMISGLADYFDMMSEVIIRHGGTIDKFIGDGIMAFWGAPRDDADHTANACRAVAEIKQRLQRFNEERAQRGEPPFETRIALHRGYAFVGNVGSRHRFAYTALGDVVNTASRLEAANKTLGTNTLVSRSVACNAGPSFDFVSNGRVPLNGKAEPVEVFEFKTEHDAQEAAKPQLSLVSSG